MDVPLKTGIKVVDALTPIGRGQRQLIVGDRNTGKTALVRGHDHQPARHRTWGSAPVVCVYCAVGPEARQHRPHHRRSCRDEGAMGYTIVVAASASAPAAMQYLAPVRRLRHRRVLHGAGRGQPGGLRRPVPARVGLPADLAAPGKARRAGGVSRGHLLPALAPAGARRSAVQGSAAAVPSRRFPSSRPRPGTSPPTSPRTSSPSRTARSTWRPTCSTRASVRP